MARTTRNENGIKMCSINICGLSDRSKLMINKYNYLKKFDIVKIQETGTDKIEKLSLHNMKMISDSNQANNRGTALYVKNCYTCTKLPEISRLSKELDSTWGLAVIKNKRYIVGSVYVKLNYQKAISDTIQMLKAAQNLTKKLKACGVILSDDYNARHPMWGDAISNSYGKL